MNAGRSSSILKCLTAVALLASAWGCAGPLPTYPIMRDDAAARIISDRLSMIRTLSAQCEVVLTSASGDSVRLNGALAAEPPDRLRLRAWKFDQAVFDLTMTAEGLWMFMNEGISGTSERPPIVISAEQVSRAWLTLAGGFFAGNPTPIDIADHVGARLAFSSTTEGTSTYCVVDRRTLTPIRYLVSDTDGVNLYSVVLSGYRMINGVAWPTRIGFHSEDGNLTLHLDDVELNGEVADGAFVPPARAVKQP